MTNLFPIRVRATGLIVEDDRVLLTELRHQSKFHYNLPGGGVQADETIREAVAREVLEETSAEADVGPLAFALEYEPNRDRWAFGSVHMLIMVFACTLRTRPQAPAVGDTYQVGIRWVPVDDLPQINLIPHVADVIQGYMREKRPSFFEQSELWE